MHYILIQTTLPFMQISHKWLFYLLNPKKYCNFAPAIPRRGCLRIIGWGSRHIKKAFITLCSDWQKSRKFRTKESGLSNDRCPRDVYILYTRTFYLGVRAHMYISAWASRCRFYSLRQCESLWQWNDNSRTPRFFVCLYTNIN